MVLCNKIWQASYIDGLALDCSNSSALEMELLHAVLHLGIDMG